MDTNRDRAEYLRQLADLQTPCGAKGSGYVRYAAAMYFHKLGLVTAELLEIYRICSKLDSDDPLAVAALQQIKPHGVTLQSLKEL